MKAEKGQEIDHKDGNGLNNQKSNLRLITHTQNCMNRDKNKNNTSGYKGVHWHKNYKKWGVQIRVNGKCKSLGYYDTKKEAAQVYNEGVKKYFGEVAKTNEIFS